ncbi:MAG: T9SS type A sorting domain-containing protein [Candidatus Eisenbacteria bacterium]|nr:T9SS type A sorting domain-containing protein [Candidatus Eisenbacteria bacterium]
MPGVPDGKGGALMVWSDSRNYGTNYDLYCQRVERYGQLGNPEPAITSVGDVKNDQGGFVKVVWSASYLDADPTYGITEYRLFRSVPGAALASALAAGRATTTDSDEAVREGKLLLVPNGAQVTSWEFVGSQTAETFASYSRIVATTADSVGGSNPRTYFLVEARASTSISSDRWSSAPDSGYSVDNLAPAAPAPLTGQYAAGTTQLHWNRNTEADLAGYRLYRGSNAAFVPGPANFVAQLPDTGAADAAGAPYVYKLTAVDVHGNESPVATLIPSGTLGVDGGATRAALSFAAPSPNPARGSATLRFSLSRAGAVRVNVYDAAGRCVATPVNGTLEAGEHSVAFALRDDAGRELPAGLYLARLEAEGRTITRRIAAVK